MLTQNDGAGGRGFEYYNGLRSKPILNMRLRLSTICAAFAVIFLVLCAQFEGFTSATVVILTVPFDIAAEARSSIGWVVFGGLGLAAIFTLYLTPVIYLLLARFSAARANEAERLRSELEAARAIADDVR